VPAIADGYSTAGTNGGHSIYANSPDGWGHVSPGNINWHLLQDFASVALNELSIIGKQITTSFYGTAPKRSYWNGCSTGGRQGLMLAQRFPDAFDGIVAIAPAINWARLLVGAMWPQQYMRQIDFFPLPCELDYVYEAVLEACDGIDGVEDGIISSPSECNFDPESLVGKEFSCNGTTKTFAPQTAAIAEEFWRGAVDPAGRYSWYGLYPGTEFFNRSGLAGTICQNSSQSSCTGRFEGYFEQWTRYYVMKDADFDVLSLTEEDFFNVMRKSIQEFDSVIGTADPDLSQFHKRGGKMITWHGLTDQLISPNGTVEYYERVMDVHPDAHDFYRYFEAPGVAHCSGGPGPRPRDDLGAVVKWVEEGEAPDVLEAISPAGDGTVRNLCPYPSRQVYVGGDPKSKDSFACE
jgi:feruloyl esterase